VHLIEGLSTYTVIEVSNAILQLAVSECFVHSSLYNMQARVHDERQFVIRTQAAQCDVSVYTLQCTVTGLQLLLTVICLLLLLYSIELKIGIMQTLALVSSSAKYCSLASPALLPAATAAA
jgi:hypothetical protein